MTARIRMIPMPQFVDIVEEEDTYQPDVAETGIKTFDATTVEE